jgi:hypothetical protein
MTPTEANEQFGATHYTVMRDDVTPQLFYKQKTIPCKDGTSKRVWVYLSFANIWMGAAYADSTEFVKSLKVLPALKH